VKSGWIYIMMNKRHATLYIGVTSVIDQHRNGTGSDFCRRYGLHKLVYVEHHDRIDEAIAREKALKVWKRAWKIQLIEEANPNWDDLFEQINA